MELEYHALTVDVNSGKSYWNKKQQSIESVYDHLQRYCQRHCHVFIFTKSQKDSEIRLVEQIQNYNGS